MSATRQDPQAAQAVAPAAPDAAAVHPEAGGDGTASGATFRCEGCDAPLQSDQEWCLECGSARTLIHRPPNWRAPVALVAGVALLVLAGLAIALTDLSTQSNRDAAATLAARTVTVTAPAPAAATPSTSAAPAASRTSPTATSGSAAAPTATAAPATPTTPTTPASSPAVALGSWPIGLPGWTVVLASRADESIAERLARRFAGQGVAVGVLDSSQHPSMIPGRWIVFSGRYPTRQTAAAAAAALKARGYRHARARVVAPTGG